MCVCVVSCVSTEPDHGGVCAYVLCLNTGNEPIMHARFGKHTRSVMVRIEYTGVSCENVWNHCVYTSSSTPIARANACTHARRMDGCDGIDARIRLSSTREETDARDARTATIDIDRIERLSPSRLSRVSIDRFDRRIHRISFIHSFRCDRRDARTHERTNEPRDDALERDATDERREILDERRVRSHRARRERYARLERTTRRIAHSSRARILNHPPETIARELQ